MGQTPNTPKYNQEAAKQEQNRVNLAASYQKYADVNGPMGGYYTTVDPTTGQLTVNQYLSDNSQNALNQQLTALQNYYDNDGTDAANAYYNAQMAYLQPQMQRQTMRSETALTNRGIPIGGSAWNEYMGDVRDAQNQQLSNLGTAALSAGQGYQNNFLNQANMLGSQVVTPELVAGQAGAGFEETYSPQYENAIKKYQTLMSSNHANQQILGGIGSLAGGIIGGIYGGPGGAAMGASIGGAAGTGIGAAADSY